MYEQRLDLTDPGQAAIALHEMGLMARTLHRLLPDSGHKEGIGELLLFAEGTFGSLQGQATLDAGYDFATNTYAGMTTRKVKIHAGVPGQPDPETSRSHAAPFWYADKLSCAAKLQTRLLEFTNTEGTPYDIGRVDPRFQRALAKYCATVYSDAVDLLARPDHRAFKGAVIHRLLTSDDPRDKVLAVGLERSIHRAMNPRRFEQ